MAAQPENTYISETVKDSIEIPMANMMFSTVMSSEKGSESTLDLCYASPEKIPE